MEQCKGKIFDIQKFSVHDGPGIRTIVFMKGCPLNCLWCSNPESQRGYFEIGYAKKSCINCNKCISICAYNAISDTENGKVFELNKCRVCAEKICANICPSKAITVYGKDMTVDTVMKEIEKDELFYKNSGGGVTISGGEPMMQPDFVRRLLMECKERGYHTAIETCSYSDWISFEKVKDYTDLYLCDIKHLDDSKHKQFTGVSNKIILDNLKRLSKTGASIIARLPIIPGFNDDDENIKQIGTFIKELGVTQVDILPYHKLGSSKYASLFLEYGMGDTKSPSKEQMERIQNIMESLCLKVEIGG